MGRRQLHAVSGTQSSKDCLPGRAAKELLCLVYLPQFPRQRNGIARRGGRCRSSQASTRRQACISKVGNRAESFGVRRGSGAKTIVPACHVWCRKPNVESAIGKWQQHLTSPEPWFKDIVPDVSDGSSLIYYELDFNFSQSRCFSYLARWGNNEAEW